VPAALHFTLIMKTICITFKLMFMYNFVGNTQGIKAKVKSENIFVHLAALGER
jgi:hypothetical protein